MPDTSMDDNKIAPPQSKCVYHNRTNPLVFDVAYEGIPENLLLNSIGWMVRLNSIPSVTKKRCIITNIQSNIT